MPVNHEGKSGARKDLAGGLEEQSYSRRAPEESKQNLGRYIMSVE